MVGAEVVDAHHVRVVQTARRLGLHPEALGVRRLVGAQELHRHRTVEGAVRGPPHLTHGAAPQRLVQVVAVRQKQSHVRSFTVDDKLRRATR